MSANEMIDILNDDGQVIDTISRELAEQGNHTTQNVLVFVFSVSGEVWTQLRPKNKKHYPGKWDISACGGVISGESHSEAAHRETLEEMGIELDLHYVESFLNVFPGDANETRTRLSHLYIGISNQEPSANADVDEFQLWQLTQLRSDVVANSDRYIPSFLIELDKALRAYKNLINK